MPTVDQVLGPGSPIARGLLADYEDRPGQLMMARAVEAALAESAPLFVEAGTGTGKTLAYLVPAVLSGKKVVISTATHALEEQIFAKDIPLVAEALRPFGIQVRAALMKGLGNYVCRRRLFETLSAAPQPLAAELAAVARWAKETESGDRSELVTLAETSSVWASVQSGTDTRIGARCSHYEDCFVTRMKRAAEDAQIVVVNHHLYCADLALKRTRGGELASVVPPHDAVIFDEAHQLEDVATTFFGVRLSSGRFDALVRDARKLAVGLGISGASLERACRGVETAAERAFAKLARLTANAPEGRRSIAADDLDGEVGSLLAALDEVLGLLYADLDERAPSDGVQVAARRAGDLREVLRSVLAGAASTRRPSEGRFVELDHEIDSFPPPSEPPPSGRLASKLKGGTATYKDDDLGHVALWLDVRDRSVALGASPIDLARTFRESLFDRVATVVCTSATLAVSRPSVFGAEGDAEGERRDEGRAKHEASFHFFRSRLGAPPETRDLVVASPFDFPRRVGIYVPRDMPEPSSPGFELVVAERALRLIQASGGGAFVLSTSHRAMRAIHQALRKESLPGPLYVQGEAPKHVLLSRFRSAGNAVLCATMSFWEGVDVPGEALRLVVLDKIPFAVPSDPIVAARSAELEAAGGNAFTEYSVPMAAIALKQGFGRLVRTKRDAGVVAILDRRLVARGYGRLLLASLPPARRLHSMDEVGALYAEFFALVSAQGSA